MAVHLAIDLGTTNTVVAVWREGWNRAQTLHLSEVSELDATWHQTPLIPTAVYLSDSDGRRANVGKLALRDQELDLHGALVRSFKPVLGRASHQAVAQVGGEAVSARKATEIFLRQILLQLPEEIAPAEVAETIYGYGYGGWKRLRRPEYWKQLLGYVKLLFGWEMDEEEEESFTIIIPAPVDSYEPYRAELQAILNRLGIRRFHSLDEPVAAALGYEMDVKAGAPILVVDFGGGSLDVALVRPQRHAASRGRSEVLAAAGAAVGGDNVDKWLLEFCEQRFGHSLAYLGYKAKAEVERVKISLSQQASDAFRFPGHPPLPLNRDEMESLLINRRLYHTIQQVIERTLIETRRRHQVSDKDIEAVLLVGGSTLLVGVRELIEELFGRERVRYWLPFEAVAQGAAAFGAGRPVQQIIHHDYALRVYNRQTQKYEYPIIIPRGTPYPTPTDFVEKYFAPAQTHGAPQHEFELPIYEIGVDGTIVGLNEADPTMGQLKPPGEGTASRLRISFSVDADRWVCVTVYDLLRKTNLMTNLPVVRVR